jgi:hypothetical protein
MPFLAAQAVFRRGAGCLPPGTGESPAAVPSILAGWAARLQAAAHAQGSATAAAATGNGSAALGQANAAELSARIVAHFQLLFDVPDLDAVLPAINQASGPNSTCHAWICSCACASSDLLASTAACWVHNLLQPGKLQERKGCTQADPQS